MMTMNGPQFNVDDHVYFSQQKIRQLALPEGRFVVVAVMPVDQAGNRQYRIRPANSGPLRVASELELKH